MTQQDIHDFMTAQGFEWYSGSKVWGSPKLKLTITPPAAALMLQLTLEARRDEAELSVSFAKTCASLGHYIAHGEERLAEFNNQLTKGEKL